MSRKANKKCGLEVAEIDAILKREAKRKGAPSPTAGFSYSNENSSDEEEFERLYRNLGVKGLLTEKDNRKISGRVQKKERAKGDHKISSSRRKCSDDHDLKPRAKAKVADQGCSSSGTAAKAAAAVPATPGMKKSSSDTRKVAAKVSSNRTTGHKERKTQSAGRASAESKASRTQAKNATTLDSKRDSASFCILTCQKEGCNTELTGTQRSRCKHHAGQCKKKGCVKLITDHSLGLCYGHTPRTLPVTKTCQKEGCNKPPLTRALLRRCEEHIDLCLRRGCKEQAHSSGLCKNHNTAAIAAYASETKLHAAQNALVARTCQKEGCNRTLTRKKKNRCEEHKNLCRKEGCTKPIHDHSSGLCYGHTLERNPPALKKCQKEGCDKTLTRKEKNRCEEHRNQCSKRGCSKPILISGLCRDHVLQKAPTTKGNKGQASNNRKDDKKEGSNTKPDSKTKTSK